MSTQIATLSRPSYLPAESVSALDTAARAGVGGAAPFPHISIAQSRWRVIDAEGVETVLKTFDVDVAIVAVNPAKSKTYYAKVYSPGETEPTAPDCYSDDGIKPGENAQSPQAPSCMACPHNVWGSAVNPVSGKKVKACKDSKRVSVAFINDGKLSEVYGWRLSPMNMIAFADFVQKEVSARGISLSYIVVRASFDDSASYPKVQFSVLRNMTADEYAAVNALREEPIARIACGLEATPIAVQARVVEAPKVEAPKVEAKPAPAKASKLPEVQQPDADLEALIAKAMEG